MPQREDDNSILWHGYIHVVTEHKRVEQELQERIERYELVLDGGKNGIWDWDVRNKRIHFSSRWKAMLGFTEEEVGNCEEDWRTHIHPDDLTRVMDAVQSHFDGKRTVFCEEYRVLIETHGGKMWAEQNDGMGLSIHFTLPLMI
ncbi:MAG: PAS domain-containing protein [Methylococcales bacterium]|nr:PAS domain-containing protein [Methylococcales bacterium]